jgi:23S rRNA (uracil1939-C5)-methyltransferase
MPEATGETPAARGPRRGEQLEVEIESLAFGGRGVARADGYVVFVAGGLPGDRVRVEVTKAKKRFAEARTVELLKGGADRIADRCVHGGEPCPGAPWQGLDYEQQLREKSGQVEEALRRIGGLEGYELEQIVPAEEQWRYRNKLEYSFGPGPDEQAMLGFHARGRWDLVADSYNRPLPPSALNTSPPRPATPPATRCGTGPAWRSCPPSTAASAAASSAT